MDKFLINSDKNNGLSNVANINSLNRNQLLRDAHTRQRDYNKVLRDFKRDMIYKINQFDPSNPKSSNDIYVNNLWFSYIFKDISNRDYASILKICNIEYNTE